jgi:DNA-binding protein HU-beta
MNKADLIDRIASGSGISKAQAASAIDTTVDSITSALKKGDRVALIGFGTFSVSQRKPRNERSPQTGVNIKLSGRRIAKFTPGREKPITVRGRFATPRETAKALGVSDSRTDALINAAKHFTYTDTGAFSRERKREPGRFVISAKKKTGSTHAKFKVRTAKTSRSKTKR